jgi:hypothetical protein
MLPAGEQIFSILLAMIPVVKVLGMAESWIYGQKDEADNGPVAILSLKVF